MQTSRYFSFCPFLRCCECERRLQRGDEFVLKEVKSEDEEGGGGSGGGKAGDEGKDHKRSKRPRTILTTQQRRAFKASFEVSSKPCRKMKKIARRAAAAAAAAGAGAAGGGRRGPARGGARERRQRRYPPQSRLATRRTRLTLRHTQELSMTGMLSTQRMEGLLGYPSLPTAQAAAGLGPQQSTAAETIQTTASPPPQLSGEQLHAYDSETVFHDLDSDGSLGHLGDCLLATGRPGGKPIDRLYSMQNSYFTS
ncbi:hypothetical protein CRUP_036755 [Coryphaenoides rupestris]|nr:hypothetical protein CRUP_036755 [Coryphaenoides rupestris]